MMLEKILRTLRSEPLALTAPAFASIKSLFEGRLANGEFSRDGTDMCGGKVDIAGMTIADGVAQIPIRGAIGQGLNGFAKGMGAVDVEDVETEINLAEADPSVKVIAFIIDSPGGMVSGTPELASRIKSIKKSKYAFAAGQTASAAYWLASQTDAIFVTETSDVGSIGVYLAAMDETEAYRAQGLKVDLIKAGKLKGIGFPGTAMGKDQREHLQARVDDIHNMFKSQVQKSRRVKVDAMEGQTFMGQNAIDAGLADYLVSNRSEFLKMIAPK